MKIVTTEGQQFNLPSRVANQNHVQLYYFLGILWPLFSLNQETGRYSKTTIVMIFGHMGFFLAAVPWLASGKNEHAM